MRKLVVVAIAALAAVIVPFASATQVQAESYASTNGTFGVPARGVQANVSVTKGANSGTEWIYSNVRLEKIGSNLVQIGWFKTIGNLSTSIDDCMTSGNSYEGIWTEWQTVSGTFHCYFLATPPGYTWGQPVFMQVKYLGDNYGDAGIIGDFTATFDNYTTYPLFDLGWSPATNDVYGSVGSEWRGDTPPGLYRTSFTNTAYQAASGGANDPFIVSSQEWFNQSDATNFPFSHAFSYASGANNGCITYPSTYTCPTGSSASFPSYLGWYRTGSSGGPTFGGNKGVSVGAWNAKYGADPAHGTIGYGGVRLDNTFTGTVPTGSTHGYIQAGPITAVDFFGNASHLGSAYLDCLAQGSSPSGVLVQWRVEGQTTDHCAYYSESLAKPHVEILKSGTNWQVTYSEWDGTHNRPGTTTNLGSAINVGFSDTTAAAGLFLGIFMTPTNSVTCPPNGNTVERGWPTVADPNATFDAFRVKRGGGSGNWVNGMVKSNVTPLAALGSFGDLVVYESDFSAPPDAGWLTGENDSTLGVYGGAAEGC